MRELARRYEQALAERPGEPLLILFDVDGTILDTRYLVQYVLRAYDRVHDTAHFRDLEPAAIDVRDPAELDGLLEGLAVPRAERDRVRRWYVRHRDSREALLAGHRPFAGVMEVIRWFQIQPGTHVGLNSGRPERLRETTVRQLNGLGDTYKVRFHDELLWMNPRGWRGRVPESKVEGVAHFRSLGFHVFAVVDDEPENLRAIAEADPAREILLLHADTTFRSRRETLPEPIVSGRAYDLTLLATRARLPRKVQFVWRNVTRREAFEEFVRSNVRWAELPVVRDPADGGAAFSGRGGEVLGLDEVLHAAIRAGRSVKLDLPSGGSVLHDVIQRLRLHRVRDENVWFEGRIENLREGGLRAIREAFPRATLQCPVTPIAGLVQDQPDRARAILETCADLGITRFSLSHGEPGFREVLDRLRGWRYEVHVDGIVDLHAFLATVLLLPTSVSADLDFPRWSSTEPVVERAGRLPAIG